MSRHRLHGERARCRGVRFAVEWIAANDQAAVTSLDEIADSVTLLFAADLFGVDARRLAILVRRRRAELFP